MNTIIFILLSISLLIVLEVLKRNSYISNRFSRRLAHIGAGAINIAAPFFVSHMAIIIVNILFAGLLVINRYTSYFSSIQTSDRESYGDIYFPLGIIVAAVVLLPDNVTAFQYGVAIMGISDALAGFVGEQWGQKKIPLFNCHKTLIGSIIFYISSLTITLIFVPQMSLYVFVCPLVLTATEIAFVFGLDNLVLPTASGLLYLALL